MKLTRYLLLSIGGTLLLAAVVLTGYTYQGVKSSAYERLYGEGEAIYNFLMSVCRVYQKQFLESGIALSDKTIGFLPAHSLPRISEEFSSNWDSRGIRISTASDRPRNQADPGELEAISWFREDDERTVFSKTDAGNFLYARPIWVVQSCLKCHGEPEQAPPSIRKRYPGAAYGYEVGDLRGVVSIRIPVAGIEQNVLESFAPRFLVLMVAFLMIVAAVYAIVRYLVARPLGEMVDGVREISYDKPSNYLPRQSGELGEFVDHFNQMMQRQHQLHAALREQKEKMERILESMEEGVIITDVEGRILHVNQKLEQWTGWPTISHFGAPIQDLFVEEGVLNGRKQCQLRCDEGREIPVHVSMGELQTAAGSAAAAEGKVFVVHDQREQLKAEQQESYAAYQAGIAEMSTMILHNVGNALAAIDGGVYRLRQQLDVLKRMDALFEMIADRLKTLTGEGGAVASVETLNELQKMVDVAKQEVLSPLLREMEEQGVDAIEHSVRHIAEIIRVQQSSAALTTQASRFYLHGVIQDALVLQRHILERLKIEVVEQMPDDEQQVVLPRNQLVQLVNNLLKNSYESISEQRQRVPELQGKITLILEQSAMESRISVIDNGEGVDPDFLGQLFQFGVSSKERGSGFGLHASFSFVENLGGSLVFESDGVGEGASVVVTLPNQVEG